MNNYDVLTFGELNILTYCLTAKHFLYWGEIEIYSCPNQVKLQFELKKYHGISMFKYYDSNRIRVRLPSSYLVLLKRLRSN